MQNIKNKPNMKNDLFYKHENIQKKKYKKRNFIDLSKKKSNLIKSEYETKYNNYVNLEIPKDISQINEHFKILHQINIAKFFKEALNEIEKNQLNHNIKLIVKI